MVSVCAANLAETLRGVNPFFATFSFLFERTRQVAVARAFFGLKTE
jgi:hypothetical protein